MGNIGKISTLMARFPAFEGMGLSLFYHDLHGSKRGAVKHPLQIEEKSAFPLVVEVHGFDSVGACIEVEISAATFFAWGLWNSRNRAQTVLALDPRSSVAARLRP
jgi:hypothetical protein